LRIHFQNAVHANLTRRIKITQFFQSEHREQCPRTKVYFHQFIQSCNLTLLVQFVHFTLRWFSAIRIRKVSLWRLEAYFPMAKHSQCFIWAWQASPHDATRSHDLNFKNTTETIWDRHMLDSVFFAHFHTSTLSYIRLLDHLAPLVSHHEDEVIIQYFLNKHNLVWTSQSHPIGWPRLLQVAFVCGCESVSDDDVIDRRESVILEPASRVSIPMRE
jgi:hypothetical protein